ncbi:MAG: FecR family protein [bacterium]
MNKSLCDDFERSAAAVLDQVATREEVAQFNALLHEHPELAEIWLDQAQTHALLECRGRNSGLGRGESRAGAGLSGTHAAFRLSGRCRTWCKAAAAAVLLSGLWGGFWCSQRACAIATLEVTRQVHLTAGRVYAFRYTRNVFSGEYIRAPKSGGKNLIVWKDGSTLRLNSETSLVLERTDGEKRITVLSGEVEAQFTRQKKGEGYVIVSPRGQATVLGTTVYVNSGPVETVFSVLQGRVLVKRFADGIETEVASRYEVKLTEEPGAGMFKPTRFFRYDRFMGSPGGGAARSESGVCAVGA